MAGAVAERVGRYILDGTDEDLRRLLRISQLTAEMARAAFRRVGVQEGWNAVDCGCGPIGGLAVMAELVGPGGRIVGVDFSEPAVQQARAVARALGLGNVEVVAGDIHELDPATLGGPFDLAYTRLFLMHQADPAKTLRRIAELLRPGGWLVAQEPLRTPPPRSHPDLEALGGYWELLHQLLERAGVPPQSVEGLQQSAREAGLEVAGTGGCFTTTDPEVGFELHAATIAAARERAIRSGVATEQQIDDLVGTLRAAKGGEYGWVSTPFFLDLTLRKPMSA
jgi:SAM-dependent methyltransferase